VRQVAVPCAVGETFEQASSEVQAVGFAVARNDVDSNEPKDTVVGESPRRAGSSRRAHDHPPRLEELETGRTPAGAADGARFSLPSGWRVTRTQTTVAAAPVATADGLVSVSIFRLLRPYTPALLQYVVPELDRAGDQLAGQLSASLSASRRRRYARESASGAPLNSSSFAPWSG